MINGMRHTALLKCTIKEFLLTLKQLNLIKNYEIVISSVSPSTYYCYAFDELIINLILCSH